MSIEPGTLLGAYEIIALLGKGGMGEVYRARDPKLKRDVALKIIPDEFSHDADRTSRFAREAEVLASLNHPNIAAIYDLQEANGSRFLVLELVEGETLADHIARGPMPLEEALLIAQQIAEALEAAHEKGIIHRDLKPANIKITPDGTVKVLDFGLAKALDRSPAGPDKSNSPTLSMVATNAGVILGTAAYMSPEQTRGKTIDKRADVWAFGCVLYEMLTGEQVFDGGEITDILAAIIRAEPNMLKLPAATPQAIRQLLRRCLVKDRNERLPDIAMARIEIKDVLSVPADALTESKIVRARVSRSRVRLAWGLVAVLTISLITIIGLWSPRRTVPLAEPVRVSSELGADISLATNAAGNSSIALSPDGTVLAFVAAVNGGSQIYVRRLGQLQATPLPGTNGAISPFFSPDGQWLGFFADLKLKKIALTGGAVVTLCAAPNGRGGSWGDDGNIVFCPDLGANITLQRVSSAGGKPESATKLAEGEMRHSWPQVLPGAKALLYSATNIQGNWNDAQIVVQSLPSGVPKVLIQGGYHAQYVPDGYVVYVHDTTLFAVPFDVNRLEVTGQPAPVVEGITAATASGSAQFALSNSGTLAYLPGQNISGADAPILWMDRQGQTLPLRSTPANWSNPQFSPDGKKLAMDINDGNQQDVWIYEWARDTLTRLTFDLANDGKPVWTPDGQRIAFGHDQGKGTANLYWQRADGSGEIQRLTDSPFFQLPVSFHPSGKYLAFNVTSPQTRSDIWILPLEGDEKSGWKAGKPTIFLNSPANEYEPMFSPDGRWIAYMSDESGRSEIFVRPFPGPGGKWQISTAGGTGPTWSRTRPKIFYSTPDVKIMVASYGVEGESFKADKPRLWSEQPILPRPRQRWIDLHPDGNRFAVGLATPLQAEEKRDKVVLIFSFLDELRRIAPRNN